MSIIEEALVEPSTSLATNKVTSGATTSLDVKDVVEMRVPPDMSAISVPGVPKLSPPIALSEPAIPVTTVTPSPAVADGASYADEMVEAVTMSAEEKTKFIALRDLVTRYYDEPDLEHLLDGLDTESYMSATTIEEMEEELAAIYKKLNANGGKSTVRTSVSGATRMLETFGGRMGYKLKGLTHVVSTNMMTERSEIRVAVARIAVENSGLAMPAWMQLGAGIAYAAYSLHSMNTEAEAASPLPKAEVVSVREPEVSASLNARYAGL